MADIESRWRAAVRDTQLTEGARKQLPLLALYPLVAVGQAPPAWLTRPLENGGQAVPCYLSEASARHAARGQAQVVRASGRDFLESLGDCYLWLDPEGVGLLMSPQEVHQVLQSIPPPRPIGTDSTLAEWTSADDLPATVRSAWLDVLKQYSTVRSAYWLARKTPPGSHIRRVVVLTTPGEDLPRLMDTMVHAMRGNYSGDLRIEAQAMIEGDLPEAEAKLKNFDAFYRPPLQDPRP